MIIMMIIIVRSGYKESERILLGSDFIAQKKTLSCLQIILRRINEHLDVRGMR